MKNTVLGNLITQVLEIEKRGVALTMSGVVSMLVNSCDDEKSQIIEAFNEGVDYEKNLLGKVDYPAMRYYHSTYAKK